MTRFQLRESTEVEAVQVPLLTLDQHPVRDWPELKETQSYPVWLRQAFDSGTLKPRWSHSTPTWVFDLTWGGQTSVCGPGDWVVRENGPYLFKRTNEVMMQDYIELPALPESTDGVPIFMPGSLNRDRSVGTAQLRNDGSIQFKFQSPLDAEYIGASLRNRSVAIAFIDSVPQR